MILGASFPDPPPGALPLVPAGTYVPQIFANWDRDWMGTSPPVTIRGNATACVLATGRIVQKQLGGRAP